jgi:hypothetical protein
MTDFSDWIMGFEMGPQRACLAGIFIRNAGSHAVQHWSLAIRRPMGGEQGGKGPGAPLPVVYRALPVRHVQAETGAVGTVLCLVSRQDGLSRAPGPYCSLLPTPFGGYYAGGFPHLGQE